MCITKKKGQKVNRTTQNDESADSSSDSENDNASNAVSKVYRVSKIHKTKNATKDDTPRMKIKVRASKNATPFKIKALPDSGATKTIIAHILAREHNVRIKQSKDKLFAANDTQLACEGHCAIWLDEIKTEALISSTLTSELIISWTDLVRLDVISANFPSRQAYHTAAPVTTNPPSSIPLDDLIEHFGDCLLYTSPSPRDKRQTRMPSSA